MAHSWEIKQANSKHINIPSGFKSYEIGPITVFKLVNSDKGSYKSIDEISDAIIKKIVHMETSKLKAELKIIKKKHNQGSLKGIDIRYIINTASSLIKRVENNNFEELNIHIQRMLQENIAGGKLNNYELLFNRTINGFKQFWTVDYPKIEKHSNILFNFKKATLDSLKRFEVFIKENKKNLKNINKQDFKSLNDAIDQYGIELNANSIIKKNHYFKKLISNDNLIDDNFSNHEKFDSWLNLEKLIYDAIKNSVQAAKEVELQKQREVKRNEEISNLKNLLVNNKLYFPSYLFSKTEKEIEKLYTIYDSKKIEEINRMLEVIKSDSNTIKEFVNDDNVKFLIIEGMAGTGKTETINFLLSEIFSKEDYLSRLGRTFNEVLRDKYEVVVCAPSNVAVANIRQRNIFFAKTFQNVSNQIKHQSPKYKNIKYLIIDEANMLTSLQIKNLVKNLKEFKEINFHKLKFVFIGDEGQILPFHHSTGVKEYSSYGLDSNFLKEQLCKERQVTGTGLTLSLSFDHRFKLNNLPEDYIESVKWLRTEPEDDVITEFLERNHQSGVVETIKEENVVINIFNREVSLGTEIRETLQNDEEPNFDKIKVRYDQALKGVSKEDFFLACNLYKDQKNRRPELGKQYSKVFPKIKERINDKSQLSQVIILHRSNEQVIETNLGIRPHLFPEDDPKKIEDTLILRGDILIVESSQFDEDQDLDNQVYPGESVVVLDADTVDIKEHGIETYGNFWKLTVRPVFRLQDRQLDVFKQKIPFLSKKNKEIVVWDGYLNSTLKYEKIFPQYMSDLEKVGKDKLITKDSKELKIFKSYAVKYGYAKTNYAAQGGEWESVILQVSDSDWKGKYSNARWLYTAVSRSTKKLFFVNS